MVGLTYTPPLQPGLAVPPSAAQAAGGAVIVDISSARAAGAVQNSLGEALLEIAGPGNVITGRVTTLSADGSLTLTTDSGAQISFHHPPEVPLTLGSVVTVRIVSAGATPQVTLLAVDGKQVVARPGSTAPPPTAGAPAAIPVAPPRAGAMPGADSASAYAASLAAVLSLEDEAGAGQAIGQAGAADAPADLSATLLESVLAVLIRAMPARPGLAPVPVGTRYIADLVASAPVPSAPAAPAGSAATTSAIEPGAGDPADFQPQTASLSGRVLPPGPDGRTLVETALGTLALPAGVTLPAGTAVRLDIAAVAPPSAASAAVSPAGPSGFLEQILTALMGGTAALAEQAGEMLALPATGELLLASAWAFIVDAKRRVAVRDLAAVVRQALADAGRPDLAERFGASSADLGTVRPPATPEGWTVVTLPFLGLSGEQPVRVYTRPAGQDGEGGDRPEARGERIVVEVTLTRLGAMQFDGLVRERRFDLVIRTPAELDPGLRAVIDRAFQGALAECGYGGDLLYGRTLANPLIPPERARSGIGFSV